MKFTTSLSGLDPFDLLTEHDREFAMGADSLDISVSSIFYLCNRS